MATITIKYDDGSVGEWIDVPRYATGEVDELLLTLDRISGFPMEYKVAKGN